MRIILAKGHSLISKLILWQSRGTFSHAALLFSDNQVIESREFKGVQKMPLSAWLRANADECRLEVFTVDTTPEQEAKIRAFAEAQRGKGYSYYGILLFITRGSYETEPDNVWFCSELCARCFNEGGIQLFARTEDYEVSPGLLARSTLLKS